MPIKVKLKSTGQLGTIPDDRFDPNLFERADAPAPSMSGNALGSILASAGRTVPVESETPISNEVAKQGPFGKLASFLTAPAENTLRKGAGMVTALPIAAAGMVNKDARSLALSGDLPFLTKQEENIFRNDETGIQSSLEGAKVGANAATYIMPGGTGTRAFGVGMLRGLLGGFGATETGETDPTKIVANSLTGAATGSTLEGSLSNLPGILSSASKKLKSGSEGLQTRSYLKKFGKPNAREGGVPAFDEFKKQGIKIDGEVDDIAKSAQEILNQDGGNIHSATVQLANEGKSIAKTDVLKYLDDQLNSKVTEKAKGPIRNVIEDVKASFSNVDDIPLDEFYIAKQEWGNAGKWSPTNSTVDQSLADVYEGLYKKANSILDDNLTKGGFTQFRDINKRVSTAMKALHFAERRGSQVVPDNPLGLMDIAASGLAATATGNPLTAIPAYAANKLIQSPAGQRGISNTLRGAGDTVGAVSNISNRIPPVLRDILMRAGVTSSVNAGVGSTQDSNVAPSVPAPITAPVIEEPTTTIYSGETGFEVTPEMLSMGRMVLKDSEYNKLKDIYDIQKEGKSGKNKTEAQQIRENTQYLIDDALVQFDANTNLKLGPISGPAEQVKSVLNLADQPTLDFNTTISNLQATIAKARGGTSFTPSEQKMLDRYTPKVGDSRQQVETKLRKLKEAFKAQIN